MRLESMDGHFVELFVTGYQFPRGQSTGSDPDWDANWLMIRGNAWDGSHSWEFHDPCMTTWEARELAIWLRRLGHGNPETVATVEPDQATLWLTEPNLTFTLDSASQGITVVAVYFDAESRPAMGPHDDRMGRGHRVRLTIPKADVAQAVDHWEQELQEFPVR